MGNRPARGQDRLVPGDAAPILALKFGQGRLGYYVPSYVLVIPKSSCVQYARPTRGAGDTSESILAGDTLDGGDWKVLKKIYNILKPFRNFTLRMEGHTKNGTHGALQEVQIALDALTSAMKEQQASYAAIIYITSANRHILYSLNNSVEKLEKYQGLLADSPAYAAAIVTNPKLKWQFFEQKSLDTAHRAKQAVLSLWQREYLTSTHLDSPHLSDSFQPNLEPQGAQWDFEN